ncbi:MAG TPA: DUF4440 domain-containing protein [Chitinophagaceae bacterium]|nr:DUF4440 domain-containing protein [Chitinophagaceae bacterium]HAN38811.1 DUF4440 domain-containing protein [Chitinophagaceae bacterium]
MKKYVCICVVVMCFTYVNVTAQTKQQKVAAAVDAWRIAMIDGDVATLDKLTSEVLTYGHSAGAIETKQDYLQNIKVGNSDFVTMQLTDQQIIMRGKTAIVRHVLTGTTNDRGKPGEVKLKVLQVWQLEKGRWVLLARQSVKIQ